MGKLKKWNLSSFLLGVMVYLISPGPSSLLSNLSYWELREQFTFLSGTVAVTFMVLAVITATRTSWINCNAGGLDKAYIIHKSAAIYSISFTLIHWLTEKIPHWLISAGLIKHPGELGDDSHFSHTEIFLWESGVIIAEYLVYILFLLFLFALTKKIPYGFFRLTHKLSPVICILFMYHSATVQLKEKWLSTPAGILLMLILSIGSIASLFCLFQMIGFNKKYNSVIHSIKKHNEVIELTLKCEKKFHHKPGQYSFLKFTHHNEPHPFTIASPGDDPYTHKFAIKGLGDFTKKIHLIEELGNNIIIEGPYGEFDFKDNKTHQIWIATGIGITPFISKMNKMRSMKERNKKISLIFCSRGKIEEQYPEHLAEICKEINVDLLYIDTIIEPRIDERRINDLISCTDDTSIWYCGSSNLLEILKKHLETLEIDKAELHYDSFEMR